MTHQNHQTNGASLEDCHTNFFALTELYGIKWRKLVWERESSGGVGGGDGEEGAAPLGDPVISSYARCLAGDILCVWRRVPTQQPHELYDMPTPLSLRAAKELWIFWYGEEPDLSGLVAPELIASQGDQGSWESGLTYECRSLLFKALHNLIESVAATWELLRGRNLGCERNANGSTTGGALNTMRASPPTPPPPPCDRRATRARPPCGGNACPIVAVHSSPPTSCNASPTSEGFRLAWYNPFCLQFLSPVNQ